MADNIELDAGSGGAVVATDEDVGSAHHQYVKVEFGADGTFTKVTGVNPAASLPVHLVDSSTRDCGIVTVDGVVTANLPAATPYKNLDVDETEDEVKGTAGAVYFIHAMNLTASKLYLKFYNDTAANVTVGATTPVLSFPLLTPGDTNGAGFTLSAPNGITFSTAITVACTTGFADADTGAPAANACILNLGYA